MIRAVVAALNEKDLSNSEFDCITAPLMLDPENPSYLEQSFALFKKTVQNILTSQYIHQYGNIIAAGATDEEINRAAANQFDELFKNVNPRFLL
jgi:hypothetical protein